MTCLNKPDCWEKDEDIDRRKGGKITSGIGPACLSPRRRVQHTTEIDGRWLSGSYQWCLDTSTIRGAMRMMMMMLMVTLKKWSTSSSNRTIWCESYLCRLQILWGLYVNYTITGPGSLSVTDTCGWREWVLECNQSPSLIPQQESTQPVTENCSDKEQNIPHIPPVESNYGQSSYIHNQEEPQSRRSREGGESCSMTI